MKCNLAAFVSFSQLHFINSLETALLPINRKMKASLAKILNSIRLAEKLMKGLAPGGPSSTSGRRRRAAQASVSAWRSSPHGRPRNAFFENFANFWRARSRLYQNEILQEHMRFDSIFEALQNLHTFARLQSLNFCKNSV